MENIPSQNLLDIWKKGKTLEEAVWEFCDQKYIAEYQHINMRETKQPENPKFEDFLRGFQEIASFSTKTQIARDKLYADLYKKIKSGDLLALGYEPPIKSSDFPAFIPLHMWPPEEINRAKSSISGNELNYLSVRIVKKSVLKNKIKPKEEIIKKIKPPEIKPVDKKTGRPSLKNQIIGAYEFLQKEKAIDYSKTLSAHTELIQETVRKLFYKEENIAGISYKTISKYLGKRFKADKSLQTSL